MTAMKTKDKPCPKCGETTTAILGSATIRWHRCWDCGATWDHNGDRVLPTRDEE